MSLSGKPLATGARVALAALLGLAAALLVSCSGSSAKLIPVADAGPLQNDFETVAQAAEAGNGSCSATEAAIAKTEQDFSALPASVDAGLRNTLRNGIENLRSHALALCAQPLVQTTTANTTAKTTTTTTTTPPTETQTVTTPTTPTSTTPTTPATTPTTPTATTPGGGTPAPGVGEPTPGAGNPQGGAGAGENPGENGGAAGGAGTGAPTEGIK
jgi:hypothetical protein